MRSNNQVHNTLGGTRGLVTSRVNLLMLMLLASTSAIGMLVFEKPAQAQDRPAVRTASANTGRPSMAARSASTTVFGTSAPLSGAVGTDILAPFGALSTSVVGRSLESSVALSADTLDGVDGILDNGIVSIANDWSSGFISDAFGSFGDILGSLGGLFDVFLGAIGWVFDFLGDVLGEFADLVGYFTGDILGFSRPLTSQMRGSFLASNPYYRISKPNPLDGLFAGIGQLLGSITGLAAGVADLFSGLFVGASLNIVIPSFGGGFYFGTPIFGAAGVINISVPSFSGVLDFELPELVFDYRINFRTYNARIPRTSSRRGKSLWLEANVGARIPGSFPAARIADDFNIRNANIPITTFNGTPLAYSPYRRNPYFFAPRNEGINRDYAGLAYDDKTAKNNAEVRAASLQSYNLGVSNEIRKTAMMPYQPLTAMGYDFANSDQDRDAFLALAQSVQGVAYLTLAYLDKTVASGLATVQQQAQLNNLSTMMKEEMKNDSGSGDLARSMLNLDNREKLEECIAYVSAKAKGIDRPKDPRIAIDYDACGKNADGTTKLPTKGGVTAFCSNCADRTPVLNAGSDMGVDPEGNPYRSLMESLFFGIKYPTTEGNEKDSRVSQMNEVINVAKAFYGDYVLQSLGKSGGNSTFDENAKGYSQLKFVMPIYTPQQRVEILRNGNPDPVCGGDSASSNCPLTGIKVRYGVCPSLMSIMRSWPPKDDEAVENLKEYWLEASLGIPLDARHIEDLFLVGNVTPPISEDSSEDDSTWLVGDMKRVVENFCDSSAVAAFKMLHYDLKRVITDHLTLNTRMPDEQKTKIHELVGRIDQYIRDGEADALSGTRVGALIQQLGSEADKLRAKMSTDAARANYSAVDLASKLSSVRVGWGAMYPTLQRNESVDPDLLE